MSVEQWRAIEGYEGCYEVSDHGRVRSLDRRIRGRLWKGRVLALPDDKNGYKRVELHKDGLRSTQRVHRLVAQAFIPNPNNWPQINHKDVVKANNHISNLEWCDNDRNVEHAVDKGLYSPYLSQRRSKLTPDLVEKIRAARALGATHIDLAQQFNISKGYVSKVVRRSAWRRQSESILPPLLAAEHANNRCSNRRLTFRGRSRTLSQWSAETGIAKTTLRHRLECGWSTERALTELVDRQRDSNRLRLSRPRRRIPSIHHAGYWSKQIGNVSSLFGAARAAKAEAATRGKE